MNHDAFIPLQITQRKQLSHDVILLKLQSPDAHELPEFTAGAHIDIQINESLRRSYSICSSPSERHYYEIAFKQYPKGRGGSIALYERAHIGHIFPVSHPRNLFELSPKAPHHLLIGAGVGLTPLLAMGYQLDQDKQSFSFIIYESDKHPSPFREQLTPFNWAIDYVSNPCQQSDLSEYFNKLPEQTHIYCCAPQPLMEQLNRQCQNLPSITWHQEAFASQSTHLISDDSFELYLSLSDQRLRVAPGRSILATLTEAGIEIDSACEQGICGSCLVPWRDGEPIHRDQCLDEEEREQYIALCCAGCRSKSLTLDI